LKIIICPVCEEELEMDDDIMEDDVIVCPVCDSDLRLIEAGEYFAAEPI
jgi:uncharacterized protein YbaR (Trm112 family)